jgi:hypothetical protein
MPRPRARCPRSTSPFREFQRNSPRVFSRRVAPASSPALLTFSTADLQINRRHATVECGSLLPLSTPGRVLPYQYLVGALLAAPAAARPIMRKSAVAIQAAAAFFVRRIFAELSFARARCAREKQGKPSHSKRSLARDSLECGSLPPLSSTIRIAVPISRRGAACCARYGAAHHA